MKDVRNRKVTFLAYCLLDQNARARGMVQMPCPELLYRDLYRAPRLKNWYDNKELLSLDVSAR